MSQANRDDTPMGTRLERQLLVGTWLFAADDTESAAGGLQVFGPKPVGCFMFDAASRYSTIITKPGLARFASNDRLKATPEEVHEAMKGVYAHFGRFSFDEQSGILTLHVEGGTFPNDVGKDTIRQITTLDESTLRFTNPHPPTGPAGTTAFLTLKRASQ